MSDMLDIFVNNTCTIKDVLKKMDSTGKKVVFVIENKDEFVGVITDGDVRRWILGGGDILENLDKVINTNPKVLYVDEDRNKAKDLMLKYEIECIPLIDRNRKLVSGLWWIDFFEKRTEIYGKIKTPVVIMAGGKGSRLEPFTNVLPKPLIPIKDKTISERILERFYECGCNDFYMTVNYKYKLIKAYFQDLVIPYKISYIEEKNPLGTAGSLYLLKKKINETFFLVNCDILIDADYSDILKKHKENKSKITLVTSMKHLKIPYGVCKLDKTGKFCTVDEKPELDFLINTGMYILEPEVLNDIPEDEFYNMTDLINSYLKKDEKVGIYPISEKSWMDMGQMSEFKKMLQSI